VSMAVRTMKIPIFWYVTSCRQEYRCQSFGGTSCSHCQVDVRRGYCRTCGRHVEWPAIEQGCSDPVRRLYLVRWGLIFVGLQYQTCFMSLSGVKVWRCLSRCLENLFVLVTEVDPYDCG
jgi:hypothetical protein